MWIFHHKRYYVCFKIAGLTDQHLLALLYHLRPQEGVSDYIFLTDVDWWIIQNNKTYCHSTECIVSPWHMFSYPGHANFANTLKPVSLVNDLLVQWRWVNCAERCATTSSLWAMNWEGTGDVFNSWDIMHEWCWLWICFLQNDAQFARLPQRKHPTQMHSLREDVWQNMTSHIPRLDMKRSERMTMHMNANCFH